MFKNTFEELLKILQNRPTSTLDDIHTLLAERYNIGEIKIKEITQAILDLTRHVEYLHEKVDLYETVFAAMFGNKEHRDAFIDYLEQRGGGKDNFEIMKLMNVLNKLKNIQEGKLVGKNG